MLSRGLVRSFHLIVNTLHTFVCTNPLMGSHWCSRRVDSAGSSKPKLCDRHPWPEPLGCLWRKIYELPVLPRRTADPPSDIRLCCLVSVFVDVSWTWESSETGGGDREWGWIFHRKHHRCQRQGWEWWSGQYRLCIPLGCWRWACFLYKTFITTGL